MNERIRQLAEQAGAYMPGVMGLDAGHPEVGFQSKESFEKFAELIVKECMKLNHEYFSDEDPYSIDSLYRYHFGFQ